MKALKDKIESLESHLSKETILKTQFEKDLAIERVQKEFQNKTLLEIKHEVSVLKVKSEEYELSKKMWEVESQMLK